MQREVNFMLNGWWGGNWHNHNSHRTKKSWHCSTNFSFFSFSFLEKRQTVVLSFSLYFLLLFTFFLPPAFLLFLTDMILYGYNGKENPFIILLSWSYIKVKWKNFPVHLSLPSLEHVCNASIIMLIVLKILLKMFLECCRFHVNEVLMMMKVPHEETQHLPPLFVAILNI